MHLADLTTLLMIVFFLPAIIGVYYHLKKGKPAKWMWIGIGVTIFIFIFKPIKLDSGYSTVVQSSFITERTPSDEIQFTPSVDQRTYHDDKVRQLEESKKQFDQRKNEE